MIKLPTKTKYKILVLLSMFFIASFYAQTEVTANGKQPFCIGEEIKIVTDFTITNTDTSVTGIDSFFIQISSGYQVNEDELELKGTHLNISQSFDITEGKLTLFATLPGTKMLFSDIETAVKEVVFKTTAANVVTEKTFSLTTENANYLPITDHFYEFVPSLGITWANAKIAAENRPLYFGRQGYLATLTSKEEAAFAGQQASGTGWIGGSDEQTEGVWKWVTGPEAGTSMENFWNGKVNGSSPNYANWNDNEPNDFGDNEDYAHITDPSIGIRGAWNDLPNIGGTDLYVAKGYIVEYGAPGDPKLNIVATSSIYIPQIISTINTTVCESGSVTISANSDEGEIVWFDSLTGGIELQRGNNYTTPIISITTTYYVLTSVAGCLNSKRTAVTVNVINRPTITNTTDDIVCSGTANLSAVASAGSVFWYDSLTGGTLLHTGNNYTTPNLSATTSYFVEANNINCASVARTEVIAEVDATIPEFELEKDTYVLCSDIGSVVLKVINFKDDYTYRWTKDNLPILGTSPEINVSEIGIYKVKAISKAGCESLDKEITVKNSEIALISKNEILIIDDSDNNSIRVDKQSIGIGEYEFSLDDEFGTYNDIGFFENISTGIHTLFIRDKGGCGITEYVFSILEYPGFFTPNNDGKNDYWHINGYDKNFYTLSDIYIYNRFGVLIYKMMPTSLGWDGTYKGKLLPSSSYWFKTNLIDNNGLSIHKTGSFSLIRK